MSNLTDFKIMRIRKGLTQLELSKRLNISQQVVSDWETGRSKPSITILRLLSNTIDADVEEVIKCFE